MDYVFTTFDIELNGSPLIDTRLRTLIIQTMNPIQEPIPITWMHGTWKKYQHRGLVPVKGFPKKPRQPTPPPDDGYQTPEERDYKTNDPRILKQKKKMRKYMKENNERSTALAKGNASDIKKHHLDSTAADVVDVQPGKRARSPSLSRTEPVEEPPSKRSKTQSKKGRRSGNKESSPGALTPPNYLPTPPLRRSTRKPKNPPKYK